MVKIKKGAVFLLLASLNVSAETCDFDNSISKALCLGTIGVIGGTVIGMEKLKDAIPTKSQDVLIKLGSGEILPFTTTYSNLFIDENTTYCTVPVR